jgi:PAS domain S-box-containing protein
MERALRHRESILEATSVIAEKLLNTLDWEETILEVLLHLGLVTGTSRVNIFENQRDTKTGEPFQPVTTDICYEWTAEDIQPQINNPTLRNFTLSQDGFSRWESFLRRNQIISGWVDDFPKSERPILKEQQIKSLVVVPIFVQYQSGYDYKKEPARKSWWGMIGFDDCIGLKEWLVPEIESLRIVAEMLGAAIHRKSNLEAIRNSEERLKLALESAQQGLWIWDLTKNELFYDNIATGMLGYAENEIGDNLNGWVDTAHPDDRKKVLQLLQEHLEEKTQFFEVEYRASHKSGDWIWLFAKGRTTSHDRLGKPTRIIGTVQNITSQVAFREELHRARQLAEKANRSKSTFLATMSHEIRTPMNGVIGMTSLLLHTPLNPDQQEYVETIRASGEALLTIINDILDYSKIEADKMALEQQSFDLRECIESALDLIAHHASQKNLELSCIYEPDLPGVVIGDVTRLRQILVNLLNNAVKFTEHGEVVLQVVQERDESILEGDKNNFVSLHLSVRDTGIGIAPDQVNSLFLPFTQVDASTTRKYGGTGLGLAITSRLVEMMGGRVWAESEGISGKGSTFHVVIRLPVDIETPSNLISGQMIQLSGKHALIVDDNETNRTLLSRYCMLWGISPHTTASPHEALQWFADDTGADFDLVLVDFQMPEMNGVSLIAEMRNIHPGRKTPMILLSSWSMKEKIPEGLAIDAVLLKPIKLSQLYDNLIRVLSEVADRDNAMLTAEIEQTTPISGVQVETKQSLRILLAENNLINQKVALKMLEQIGYRADLAANGVEALQALERQEYDVILMDIQMPEMDGETATRKIRAELLPERQPYIIAMTAHAMKGDRERYLQAGMDDYLSKPVQVKNLKNALERVNSSRLV